MFILYFRDELLYLELYVEVPVNIKRMSASKKLTESAEHDMYIAQLKEVFDSCDETGSGTLERQELLQLCDKLQLDDQSEYLVNELLKDKAQVIYSLHFFTVFIYIYVYFSIFCTSFLIL